MSGILRETKAWHLWVTVLAVVLAGLGVFLYYMFFRQSESDVVECVPPDAVFVFDINDNGDFASKASSFAVYLNEIFALDALPAFETMCSKVNPVDPRFTISAHRQDSEMKLLFNLRASKSEFKKLLRALKIDQKNYTVFENCRIYTYGTDFQNMKFTYSNNVISFSTDPGLLKKAILQQIHPKKIFSDENFGKVYGISEKNRKQNWLFVDQAMYLDFLKDYLNRDDMEGFISELPKASWSCYQIRFSKNEIFFSGYALADGAPASVVVGNGFDLAPSIPSRVKRLSRYETLGSDDVFGLSGVKLSRGGIASRLPFQEVCVFTYRSDTSYVTMAAALPDSTVSVLSFYSGENVSDSLLRATVDNIYPVPADISSRLLPVVGDTVRWFAETGGTFVFSGSRQELAAYRKTIGRNEVLSNNTTFGLISDAVASSAVREFSLFNDKDDPYFYKKLSEKGRGSIVWQNIRAFSLSYGSSSDKEFVPVNVYILFQ
ncbi:MAG: hypothetical protein SPL47_04635 [Bacteroidales bacterium]|nr:hypothetical protein [Bacteroidales bacterium]